MQMQSTYWLEKVLKMISLYGVNSENCTESETYAHVGLRDGGPVFRAPLCVCVCVCVCVYIYIYIYACVCVN